MGLIEGYSSSDDDTPEKPTVAELVSRYRQEMDLLQKSQEDDPTPETTVDKPKDKVVTKQTAKRAKKNFDIDYSGPWKKKHKVSGHTEQVGEENSEEVGGIEDENDGDAEDPISSTSTTTEQTPWSQFVGSKQRDYLGRSFLHIPQDLPIKLTKDPTSHECFVPKKVITTFAGHKGGVNKIELFPLSGHLFLSCGNDCQIKLWDFYHQRELLRVYHGHSLPVKDIAFDNTGEKFLSCGYDKVIRLWETESGEVLKTVKVNAIPNTLKFHPFNDQEFIVGLSNKNIEHYDLSIPEYTVPIQVYDHHQGSINSLTIIDDGNRFMLTSDDKTVRFWDWQINIPVKFISDPSQHSMPLAKVTPDGRFIALQSMDNTIHVIQGYGKYKFNRAKTFSGHITAGYGIAIDISPDGKIIMSGDSKGNAFFWDWKSTKLVRKFKVDNKPTTCICFHPQETSKVLIGGLSGKIYCCD
ncbi:uncharacterized protein KQ657_005243 [Scheffersomyces spartinae]|uniref:Pre-mRNA-processing factor 17 n=1 Tax=Scheffersomyces spartinae TaxID=45513 RepID=A0A9P8AIU1_9ASCO|nr:uncharacterized protein KQ657_005243 [Scheffersomyces spartinae]KAG7194040.1 hypothetical protein KQ657_005243 [Scheffersomyces spartinae]